jgi:hypothetical protein
MGFQEMMVERWMSGQTPEAMASMMQEMMPKMLDSCLSKMDVEQRQGMLSLCRQMLDEAAARHSVQAA